MIGQSIGHYKILEKLGAGGMGEVYRAEDTTLDREVALKVLPSELAESQERLDRFQREAKTLAALDHPNIVTVFTVENDEDVHFLTMQLVEGKRLSDLIPKGGMSLERIFDIAIPLADALAAAHEKGVIHRDLKPANIMLSDEDRVKVLDFGLAKLRPDLDATVDTELPTEPLTGEGRILGTVPYMSPEQVEGKPVDHRTDVFSLGVVLYEMATGERPFKGDSSASLIAAIMTGSPQEVDGLRAEFPHHLSRIIRHCLEKEPPRRFQSVLDVSNELEDLKAEVDSGELTKRSVPAPHPRPWKGWVWVLPVLALVAAVSGVILLRRPAESPRPSPGPVRHKQITFSGEAGHPEISPDGAFIAYATKKGIVVRDIEGQGSVNVVESDSPRIDSMRWSPDGLRLLVSGVFSQEWRALVVPRLGGDELSLKHSSYMCWSPDGSRVASAWTNLKTISFLDVESDEVVTTTDLEGDFRRTIGIDWSLPTGLLLVLTEDDDDRYAIWTLSTSGQNQSKVFESESVIQSVRWSLSEPAIYFVLASGEDAELWKLEVNPQTGEARDSAKTILTGLPTEGIFSVSRDGARLAYARTAGFMSILRIDLDQSPDEVRVDSTQLASGTQFSRGFSVSPDGEWVAVSKGDERSSDIYLLSLKDGSMRQLTHLDGRNERPVWSPDGRTIAFGSTHDGTRRVWRVSPEGGKPKILETGDVSSSLSVKWAPGERLLYQQPGDDRWSFFDVGSGGEEPLLSDDLTESGWFFDPVYSPDGSRVALGANLGGNDVITVPVATPRRPATVLSSDTGAIRGIVSQALPAAGHQGRTMRLKARVRVSGAESQARLFLKVRLRNGETGFLETRRNRPIASIEWSDHEIVGKIDQDASEIILGGRLHGAGAAWFDEFHLSLRDEEGEWETLPLENPGFEETSTSNSPPGWRTLSPTETTFTVTSEGPSPRGKALRIEALGWPPAKGAFEPVGWSRDGNYVFLVPVQANRLGVFYDPLIYRIPSDGGPLERYLDLELSEKLWWLDLSADGEFLIVETARHQSDVWIAEGFDSDLN